MLNLNDLVRSGRRKAFDQNIASYELQCKRAEYEKQKEFDNLNLNLCGRCKKTLVEGYLHFCSSCFEEWMKEK